MPRYFFHFRGPTSATDGTGEELADEESAHRYARQVAWELARNAPSAANKNALVVVTDDEGSTLFTVSLEGSVDPSR